MGHINFNSIHAKILRAPRAQAQAAEIVQEDVNKLKTELLEDFNSHRATLEIEAGPDLEVSEVLPVGYGNLYSFLGFEDGKNPTQPVRKKLESIHLLKKPRVDGRYWTFKIKMPTEEDLENASPMDWESGRSWITAITKGLSGFSHYLFTLSRNIGRSGSAIQVAGDLTGGSNSPRSGSQFFAGTPYVYEMLRKFVKKLKRIA